jgi:ribosomal protein S27AE
VVYSFFNVTGSANLPEIVVCGKCGYILYNGADLKPPSEILQLFNEKCPECGEKLSSSPLNFEVKPAGEV